MKKLLCILFMALAVLGFAQDEQAKVAFQAFDGSFIKLKPAEKGFHKFSIKVEVAPWAFQAIGEVRAVAGDPELLVAALYEGSVYSVVSYVPGSTANGTDNKEYNVGMFDVMLFYDDEVTSVRNVKFKLLPPANDEWAAGIFKDALASGAALGNVWGGNYESDVTAASATPLNKDRILEDQKAKKKAAKDAADKAREEERQAKLAEKRAAEAAAAKAAEEERKAAAMKKKKKKRSYDEDEEEDVRPKKKKKRRYEDEDDEEEYVKPKKKKRSYDDDEEEVRPKKKKRSYDEDEDEDDRPKKKKKKKSYSDDDDDECNDPSLSVKEQRRCQMKRR